MDGTTGFAMLVFAGWLVVAAVVTLLVLPFEGASSYLPRRDVEKGDFFSQYRPPQNAPKFSVAFAARMFAVAATAGIAVYQWYLAPNIVAIPMRPVCSALPVPDRWLWSWPSARLSVL